jgi:hypothetical protein
LNDPFVIEQAQHWADGLSNNSGDAAARVTMMYVTAFGREPSADERADAIAYVKSDGDAQDIAAQRSGA